MPRSAGGRPRTDRFSVMTDQVGNAWVACDERSCHWIRPIVRNSTLYAIERLTQRHTHPTKEKP